MRVVERLEVWGHTNIRASNRMTFEFTCEDHLTLRGDCIVGVKSSKGARDLSLEFRKLARNPLALIRIEMVVGDVRVRTVGRGCPGLSFTHPTDLVGRRSTYKCSRTLMIEADKAASDFPRELVVAMKNPFQRAQVTLSVEV
ncbi:DUF371 domain-containing protein [Candidatus Bathyarchaeota archaeon]|nr:DUF371 domain-containing protein [Candidatus Bathyarchaeota archaeon]